MAGAVEMCSGLGVCRKTLDGTMCPSYMATRDERRTRRAGAPTCCGWRWPGSSTRPASTTRASVRCSISASSAAPARRSARSASTSRGSRASSSPATGSVTARRFGRARSATSHALSRWGSRARAARRTRSRAARPVRWLNEQRARPRSPADAAGVGQPRRSIASRARVRRRDRRARDGTPAVAIFNDTFTNYYNPEIGMAGLDVLERARLRRRAGAERVLRPAADLAGAARRSARHAADQHRPAVSARRGGTADRLPRAELPVGDARRRAGARLRGDRREQARSSRAPAPCCSRSSSRTTAQPGTRRSPCTRARRDPRCTATVTRSRWAWCAPARRSSAAIPAPRSIDLDAGCCGMAGSFGYSARSLRRLARDRRAPAAAGRPAACRPDAVLVASGVSCRHQVADFTGVRARATPRSCYSRSRGVCMNLAVISVAALALAVIVSA